MSDVGRARWDRTRWEWVPLLLLGAAAASVGELAAGLLLYSSEGFLRALTLVLATELSALGLGLWAAPGGDDPVEPVRRRWLFVLIAFTAAAAFSGAWALLEGFSAAPFAQGLGLAVLAGLPLYGVGALLAAPGIGGGRRARPDEPGSSSRGVRVGVAAALGGAVGILLTGVVLVPLEAPSVFLMWLVILSGGALLHGWILDGRTLVRSVETVPSPYGPVDVQIWQRGSARLEYRVVVENGRVRGGEDRAGRPVRAWEAGTAILAGRWSGRGEWEGPAPGAGDPTSPGAPGSGEASASDGPLPPGGPSPPLRCLLLGAGTGTLARLFRQAAPEGRVVVVERNAEVSRAARRHLSEDGARTHELIHDDPMEHLDEVTGPFDLLVVDGAGVAPGDPVPLLSTRLLGELRGLLSPGGILVMAPLPSGGDGGGEGVEVLLARARHLFPEPILYRAAGEGRVGVDGEDAGLVFLPREVGGQWPDRLGVLEAERPPPEVERPLPRSADPAREVEETVPEVEGSVEQADRPAREEERP